MNIAHIATPGTGAFSLVAPLQGFYRWLVDGSSAAVRPMQRNSLRQFDSRLLPATGIPPSRRGTTPALRVVRVLDHKQPRAFAGRMVISGRMADVCAELDRLSDAVH